MIFFDKKFKYVEKKVVRFIENGKVSFFEFYRFGDENIGNCFLYRFFYVENIDRKIWLYLIVFKIVMFDILIFIFRIIYIVFYNIVNSFLNYYIFYCIVNSFLNYNIFYSIVNR